MNTQGNMNTVQTPSLPSSPSFPTTSTESWNPLSKGTGNWNTITIVVVILILAFLGFNIFVYLAKGTDLVTYILEKIGSLFRKIIGLVGQGTEKTIDLTKVGVAEITGEKNKDLDQTINKKKVEVGGTDSNVVANSTDATKIQSGNKKGWCYIGTDRDYRSCFKVNSKDTCESGEIYKTKKQCEQPELRYDS